MTHFTERFIIFVFTMTFNHFCYASDRIIDPTLFESYFENASVALDCFYRMQDNFLSGNHWFLFDVTTLHTISTDFKIPVDTTKSLFIEPYETGGVEHHQYTFLLKSSSIGAYLIADATSLVPTKGGKVKYDEIEFWTYGEGIIGIFLGSENSQFHFGLFEKIAPRSFNNNFSYDPNKIDDDASSPFCNIAASHIHNYAFLNHTMRNSWNITSIIGLEKFSLYSLNFRYHTYLNERLGYIFPNIDYFEKHKNIKPGTIWRGPRIGNFMLLESGIKLKQGINLENFTTGLTFYLGVNRKNSIWSIPDNDFHFTITFSGSYSNYIGTLNGYYAKIDFVNAPYLRFLSLGYSQNYYYNLLRVPFEGDHKITLDWTFKL